MYRTIYDRRQKKEINQLSALAAVLTQKMPEIFNGIFKCIMNSYVEQIGQPLAIFLTQAYMFNAEVII